MPVTKPEGLRLHEAIVVAMIRKRAGMAVAADLADWNQELALYRQANGDWPDHDQVRLRALEYPQLFRVVGSGEGAVVLLDPALGSESSSAGGAMMRNPLALAGRVRAAISETQSTLVAVDGANGAGKTSLATLLAHELRTTVVHLDHYLVSGPTLGYDTERLSALLRDLRMEPFPFVVEGVCLLRLLRQTQVTPNVLVYVKKLDARGDWTQQETCTPAGIARLEQAGVQPPTEVVSWAVYDYHREFDPVSKMSFEFAWPPEGDEVTHTVSIDPRG